MPRGIHERRRRALRDAKQCELLPRLTRLDDSLQIFSPPSRRQICRLPVTHPGAAFVIADQPIVIVQEVDPVSPDRTLEIVGKMREPVGRLHQRGTLARGSPGNSYVIACLEVANRLRHSRRLLLVPEFSLLAPAARRGAGAAHVGTKCPAVTRFQPSGGTFLP